MRRFWLIRADRRATESSSLSGMRARFVLAVGLTAALTAALPVAAAARPAGGSAGYRAATDTPSSALRLREVRTVTGSISPKSVVSSQTGRFFAQNMMYRHTITVYDRRGRLVKTIRDAVNLAKLGYPRYKGVVRGAPVEAAFSPDGRTAYVSNYSMYGPGFSRQGDDVCSPGSGIDDSFVYRIGVKKLRINRAIKVGAVPKFLAVTPDDRLLLVSNWCSYDLSVVGIAKAKEIRRIPVGAYPRGIAVDPKGDSAYIAVMGSSDIAVLDLHTLKLGWFRGVGVSPRHLVIGPEGNFLYATLNAEGRVAKINVSTGTVVRKVSTGSAPRSMTIARDGQSLYVVNYESDTVSKVRTSDLKVVQTVRTNPDPIGITYDNATRQVWVACYSGSLMVFRDVPARG